jgi:hypothetical protein
MILSQIPNYVPSNGLVGWWPFSGNANDLSGNGNNGTVNGATLTTNRFGTSNDAYNFDGNDWIEVLNNPSVQPNNTLSISVWAYIEPTQPSGSFARIISKQYNGTQNFGSYQIITGGTNNYGGSGLTIRTGAGNSQTTPGIYNWSGPTSDNLLSQWQHIVGTYDGVTMRFYQNGILKSSISHNGNLFYDNGNLWFGKGISGASLPGNNGFFSGKIDDVGIWNRVLTQQEITNLYDGCNLNVSITNQSSLVGQNVNFNATQFSNINYQWQTNPANNGWQNVNSNSSYSGATTNNLVINNVQLSNHNQPFRVITSQANCIDTSNIALIQVTDTCITNVTLYDTTYVTVTDTNVITVYDTLLTTVTDTLIINTTLGLPAPNNENTILIYPNPASDFITIDNGNYTLMAGYSIKIENNSKITLLSFNVKIT